LTKRSGEKPLVPFDHVSRLVKAVHVKKLDLVGVATDAFSQVKVLGISGLEGGA
jgi:hypothetical protein